MVIQNNNTGINTDTFEYTKDSNLEKTDPMIASFNQSIMNKGTLNSSKLTDTYGGNANTLNDSLALSQTNPGQNLKTTVKNLPMEEIKSEGDSGSQISANVLKERDNQDDFSDSDEDIRDDIDRYEEIDLKSVSVKSGSETPHKSKPSKAILSPTEIEKIKQDRETEELEKQQRIEQFTKQCKELIQKGEYNKSEFDNLIEESNLFESAEVLDMSTKQGFNGYIETQMLKFHPNYNFETEQMSDTTGMCQSSHSLASLFDDEMPHEDEVYYYSKYVVLSSKMEKEIPLMALTYIERLLTKVGILMNHWNWRRILLTTLIVASKIWDDDSLENIHFPKVMNDISIKEVNNLEKIFLELISFDL